MPRRVSPTEEHIIVVSGGILVRHGRICRDQPFLVTLGFRFAFHVPSDGVSFLFRQFHGHLGIHDHFVYVINIDRLIFELERFAYRLIISAHRGLVFSISVLHLQRKHIAAAIAHYIAFRQRFHRIAVILHHIDLTGFCSQVFKLQRHVLGHVPEIIRAVVIGELAGFARSAAGNHGRYRMLIRRAEVKGEGKRLAMDHGIIHALQRHDPVAVPIFIGNRMGPVL